MVDEKGFAPFSAVGFVIVMLVVAMVGHAAWARHERSVGSLEETEATSVLTATASIQNDLQSVARFAVYRALWDVSKRASDYASDAERELAVERLASCYFAELAAGLPETYNRLDARVELELPNPQTSQAPFYVLLAQAIIEQLSGTTSHPIFDLHQVDGGFASSTVRLPSGTRIRASSWDNSIVLERPYENFSTFIDSRYFLLQDRMGQFAEGVPGLDGIGSTWWVAEYATAWAQALGGTVRLNEKRTRAFFELAWARHEHDTFGSADYLATSARLLGLGREDASSALGFSSSAAAIVMPISAAEVGTMVSYIDGCTGSLSGAESDLADVREHLERAKSYARSCPHENSETFAALLDNVRRELNNAVESVAGAKEHVRAIDQNFNGLLDHLRTAAVGNELIQQLYRGLTESSGTYPALGQQIASGVQGVESKLAGLEGLISSCSQQIGASYAGLENSLAALCAETETKIQNLLATSAPQRVYESVYSGPEGYVYDPENPPAPTTQAVDVYTVDSSNASLGTLRVVLTNAKGDFERMRGLAGMSDGVREKMSGVDIDAALKQKLLPDADFELPGQLSRENLYELLPPPPISSQPGLSVFHDFRITDVKYERQDPFGWFWEAAPPTRIPLWFIGLDINWAQWGVSLEVGDGAVEEVFDFDNPTLPRQHPLPFAGQITDVHKPLAYRHEMPRERFDFTLAIVLPWRSFSIAAPEMMS